MSCVFPPQHLVQIVELVVRLLAEACLQSLRTTREVEQIDCTNANVGTQPLAE
jgi:hypothetical protein